MKRTTDLPYVDKTLAAATPGLLRSESTKEHETVTLTVYNTGANPLTGFEIKGAVDTSTPGATPPAAVSLKTDGFQTPDAVVYYASGDPKTLAAGASVLLKIETSDLSRIEIWATSTLGTTIRTYASGSQYAS